VDQRDAVRRGLAEALGAGALTFVGAGSVVLGNDLVGVALAHGLILAIMVTALGHISGGHFNPAVTLGFLVTRRIDPRMALVYWASQFIGAVLAALMLRGVFDHEFVEQSNLGAPGLAGGTSAGEGFLLEMVLTFLLVLVVFATAVDPRGAFKLVGGFAIGLTIAADILVGGPLTGAAMNPSRAFGPQLVGNFWADGWIYYLAPALGGAIAALLYDQLYLRHQPLTPVGPAETGVEEPGVGRAARD
jgi:aquaporin Z